MKRSIYKSFFLFFFFAAGISSIAFAQTPSIFKSVASGTWKAAATTTWVKSVDGGATFVPATAAPGSGSDVIVTPGTTVTIDAGVSCLNLTIQAGGTLMNATVGGTNSIKVGVGTTGVGGYVDTLRVDGTFGGPGDVTPLEFGVNNASLWITGTGSIQIGRIRSTTSNVNFPGSTATGAANSAVLLIDENITFATPANYAYSIDNSTQVATDTIAYNILAGRTVTLSSPTGFWHNNAVSTGVVSSTGGKYVYNIAGTLDLTANTGTSTDLSSLIPFGNTGSSITVNVSGDLKLGAYFKADTVANSAGNLFMNINNGGLVDASLTTVLKTGVVGTASGNLFFVTNGTGALERTVPADGTSITFPIGINTNSYTPVTLSTTTGSPETFSVNVSSTFTHTPPAQTLLRQWTINEGTASGNTYTAAFAWTAADETGSGLTHGGTIYVIHWNGTTWDYFPATVTGTGTAPDPYVATVSGLTSFSPYAVTSSTPTPVTFGGINAMPSNNAVNISWSIFTELNVKSYVVERSDDGVNFKQIGTVSASGLSRYAFTDNAPVSGNGFYRIKAIDVNGAVTYSTIVKVSTGSGAPEVIIVNPVAGKLLNLQLSNLAKGDYALNIYNTSSQKVFSTVVSHPGGSSARTFALPAALSKGVYMVHLANGSAIFNKNIIVQ